MRRLREGACHELHTRFGLRPLHTNNTVCTCPTEKVCQERHYAVATESFPRYRAPKTPKRCHHQALCSALKGWAAHAMTSSPRKECTFAHLEEEVRDATEKQHQSVMYLLADEIELLLSHSFPRSLSRDHLFLKVMPFLS